MAGQCSRAVWEGYVVGQCGRGMWQGCMVGQCGRAVQGSFSVPHLLQILSLTSLEAGVQGSLCKEQGKGGSNHGRQVIENREGSQDVTV